MTERNRERARRAKEGGSSEIDSRRARRRRVVGSSRVTSGRAGAAPGSCGVCRRLRGCCCTSTRPFCVPIRTPPFSSPVSVPKPLPPFVLYPSLSYLSPPALPPVHSFFIVPYRHIGSFSNSISLNGIKTILLRLCLMRSLKCEPACSQLFAFLTRASLARRILALRPRFLQS